jgi:hypothetical protein
MKTQPRALTAAMGLGMVLVSGSAVAESQYGYDAAGGAGAVTAQSQLNIKITVPKLILLRVGAQAAITDATLTAALSGGIPGGAVVPADGSNVAANWNGTAPVWADASSGNVQAWAWTNAKNGGRVSASADAGLTGSGLTPGNITVASTAVTGGGLAHPGTNTGTNVNTDFTSNTLVSSTWVFSVSAAGLAGAYAGSYTQVMTYTATTL